MISRKGKPSSPFSVTNGKVLNAPAAAKIAGQGKKGYIDPPPNRTIPGEPMGNIRPTYIKRIALDLVKKYPTVFNEDFENNKLLVEKLTDVKSVKMRNRVAGYITRYWQQLET
jgi:small subunit ribosomal protein S17e